MNAKIATYLKYTKNDARPWYKQVVSGVFMSLELFFIILFTLLVIIFCIYIGYIARNYFIPNVWGAVYHVIYNFFIGLVLVVGFACLVLLADWSRKE